MAYSSCEIGHVGPVLRASRSPDLTSFDFFTVKPSQGVDVSDLVAAQTDLVAHLHADVLCYTRAFGYGPCNFEPWSRTTPELAPLLLTITPHQREDVSALDSFNVYLSPTRRVFRGTGLELLTHQPQVRYFDH
ncbi:hypothetical protein TNCV_3430871 [Trichonephila clavipes]|nr:hypothetical protein TNCV_3430871 [Trichonephila clavipes]